LYFRWIIGFFQIIIAYGFLKIDKDNNRINKSEDEVTVIQGSILNMIDKSEKVLFNILPKEYPTSAIVEGIKNAVLYREYSSINKIIEVNIGYNPYHN
jgi:predicted HTH transcriptional regulator